MSRLKLSGAFLLIALSACGTGTGSESGSPQVIAAFYPLEFAAERVGGGKVNVESLTPSGVEPHDLELSSDQIRELAGADLVVYLGEGFQPAVEDALAGLDASRQFDALEGKDLLQDVEGEAGETGADPHVWLDPNILATIADQLGARLTDLYPEGADLFEENTKQLQRDLMRLDREYSTGLEHCGSREFVTSHEAFGYLAARYDLEQVSIAGIDPEAEPSPQRMAEVVSFVNEHHVKTIFFEELAPPDIAETLARETGAQTEVLSPLETRPETGDYLDVMRSNLDLLRRALDCE
jgi:zinc transport system substrate-binding protein